MHAIIPGYGLGNVYNLGVQKAVEARDYLASTRVAQSVANIAVQRGILAPRQQADRALEEDDAPDLQHRDVYEEGVPPGVEPGRIPQVVENNRLLPPGVAAGSELEEVVGVEPGLPLAPVNLVDSTDFDGQITLLEKNLLDWLPIYLIQEFDLGGLGLLIPRNELPNRFYQNLVEGYPDEQKLKEEYFKYLDALENVNGAKKWFIKHVLYDGLRFSLGRLISDASKTFKDIITEFLGQNAHDNFDGVSQERLKPLLEFLIDLKRNYKRVADDKTHGATIDDGVINGFLTPPKGQGHNVELPYDDFFKVLPGIITQRLSPKMHFAYDEVAKGALASLNYKIDLAEGPEDEVRLKNIVIHITNRFFKYCATPLAKLILIIVGIIPWLLFILLPQAIMNWQIKKNSSHYVEHILRNTINASSTTEDKEGFTYATDSLNCAFLSKAVNALNNPLNPDGPPVSENRRQVLQNIVEHLWNIAPLTQATNLLELNEAMKPKKPGNVDEEGIKAGIDALNGVLDTFLKDRELKEQLARLISVYNSTFRPRNAPITSEEKLAMQRKKQGLIKQTQEAMVRRAAGGRIQAFLADRYLGISQTVQTRLEGMGKLLALEVSWKFGLCIYMIGKPLLEANKIPVNNLRV